MKEEIFQIHRYSVGYKIDKQLLLSLKDIFEQYSEKLVLEIRVGCNNNASYVFDNVDECFEFFDKKPYRIIKMEISVMFGTEYNSNKIKLSFDNGDNPLTELRFQFDNGDDYLLLKNKIELCLNNFKLSYRILSRLPIMPMLLTIVFICICVYTCIKNIIFPRTIQWMITGIWIVGSFIIGAFPVFTRIKRNLFPCIEFKIGQNALIEENNASKRNFIVGTVVIGTVLGIVGNYISDFIF